MDVIQDVPVLHCLDHSREQFIPDTVTVQLLEDAEEGFYQPPFVVSGNPVGQFFPELVIEILERLAALQFPPVLEVLLQIRTECDTLFVHEMSVGLGIVSTVSRYPFHIDTDKKSP